MVFINSTISSTKMFGQRSAMNHTRTTLKVIRAMIRIDPEIQECVQGSGLFTSFVLSIQGKRFYATEEIEVLLRSPAALAEDGAVVVVEWDRNSAELPSLGPVLAHSLFGTLHILRVEHEVIFEFDIRGKRTAHFRASYDQWCRAVERLKRKSNPRSSA